MSSSPECATPWKVAYPTRTQAEKALGQMRFRRHRREAGVSGRVLPFRCEDHWHIGHHRERPR